MRDRISNETIEKISILAKLELSDEEKRQARQDMEGMLNYIDKLGELETDNVEPMSHVLDLQNVFREDIVTNGDMRNKILANAPMVGAGMFKVPSTFE